MQLQSNTQTQYFPFISLMPSSDLYDGSTEMAEATEVKYSCCPALALRLLYAREETWLSGVGMQFLGRERAQLCEAQSFKKRRGVRTDCLTERDSKKLEPHSFHRVLVIKGDQPHPKV